jgi:hypothetical protein
MADFATDLIFDNPDISFAPKRVGINAPGRIRAVPPKPGVRMPDGSIKMSPPPVVFGSGGAERDTAKWGRVGQDVAANLARSQAMAAPAPGMQSVAPQAPIPFGQAELNLINQHADVAQAAGSGVNDYPRIAAHRKELSDLFAKYHGGMSRGQWMQSSQSPLGATVFRADPGTREFTVNPLQEALGSQDRLTNQQRVVDAMLARGGLASNSESLRNAVGFNQEYQGQAAGEMERQIGLKQAGAAEAQAQAHGATARATEAGVGLGQSRLAFEKEQAAQALAFEREKYNDPQRRAEIDARVATLRSEATAHAASARLGEGRLALEREQLPMQRQKAQAESGLLTAQAAALPESNKIEREKIAADQAKLQNPTFRAATLAGANVPLPPGLQEEIGLTPSGAERLKSLGLPNSLMGALQQLEPFGSLTPDQEKALMMAFGPEIQSRLSGAVPFFSFELGQGNNRLVQQMLGKLRVGVKGNKTAKTPGVPGARAMYRGNPIGGLFE